MLDKNEIAGLILVLDSQYAHLTDSEAEWTKRRRGNDLYLDISDEYDNILATTVSTDIFPIIGDFDKFQAARKTLMLGVFNTEFALSFKLSTQFIQWAAFINASLEISVYPTSSEEE